MRVLFFIPVLLLSACVETAWDTTIASTADRRAAMAASVTIGKTTETEFVTRWGAPTQRVREGGQTEFIYRSMRNPEGYYAPRFGDSANYVIVTFQFGQATAVRTSETEGCRATFPPNPPGPGFPHMTTVHPAATCPGVGPLSGRVHPIERAAERLSGRDKTPSLSSTQGRPGVPSDVFVGGKAD